MRKVFSLALVAASLVASPALSQDIDWNAPAPYKGYPVTIRVIDNAGSCYASRIDEMRSNENGRQQRLEKMRLSKLGYKVKLAYDGAFERTIPGDAIRVFYNHC